MSLVLPVATAAACCTQHPRHHDDGVAVQVAPEPGIVIDRGLPRGVHGQPKLQGLRIAVDIIQRRHDLEKGKTPFRQFQQPGLDFRETKSKSLQMRNKKSVSPLRTHRWSEWRDLNSRPLDPQSSALPTALHPDILFCCASRGQLLYINMTVMKLQPLISIFLKFFCNSDSMKTC